MGFPYRISLRLMALGLSVLFLAPGSLLAQVTSTEIQKMTATDGVSMAEFGTDVSVDGSVAMITAEDDLNKGAAYIFRSNGTEWVEEEKLVASDGISFDLFGASGTLCGPDMALIGKPHDDDLAINAGAVYMFQYDGTFWQNTAKLTASDGEITDNFGCSVAASGDVLVVGAELEDEQAGNAGAAYIFRWNGKQWAEERKLLASDGEDGDFFGSNVAVDGDVVVVTAIGDDDLGSSSGSAYVFRHNGTQWLEERKLLASDGEDADNFGFGLSMDNGVIAVGAYFHGTTAYMTGAVYMYRWNGTDWEEEQKIVASDAEAYDNFGSSVANQGCRLVVGAMGLDHGLGGAYAYHYNGSEWQEVHIWRSSSSGGGLKESMGQSVDLDGSCAFVGGPVGDGPLGLDTGAAYYFRATDLGFEAIPDKVAVTFNVSGGFTGDVGGVLATAMNGTPTLVLVFMDAFDVDGNMSKSIRICPGLAGFEVEFTAVGYWQSGVLGISEPFIVSFQ